VIGRTIILTVSIITKKGFSAAGAPIGNNPATTEVGLKKTAETINDNQSGKPKESEMAKCLVGLKTYGINPLRFIKMRNKKRPLIKLIKPPKFKPKDRKIWEVTVSLKILMTDLQPGVTTQ